MSVLVFVRVLVGAVALGVLIGALYGLATGSPLDSGRTGIEELGGAAISVALLLLVVPRAYWPRALVVAFLFAALVTGRVVVLAVLDGILDSDPNALRLSGLTVALAIVYWFPFLVWWWLRRGRAADEVLPPTKDD